MDILKSQETINILQIKNSFHFLFVKGVIRGPFVPYIITYLEIYPF